MIVSARWVAAVAAGLLVALPAFAAPDLVLVNAKLFRPGATAPADAVAVEKGRISAVGGSAALAKLVGPGTRVIDVGGRLLVPGLSEAHTHLVVERDAQVLPLPGPPQPEASPDAVLAAVRAAAGQGSGWMTGTIGPGVAADGRNWRAALDAASPDRPAHLNAWWGHGTIFNSAALRALGLADDAPDVPGGWYGRDRDGRLNGQLYEAAELDAQRRMAPADRVERLTAAADQAGRLYAGWGVTSVHYMANALVYPETVAALGKANPRVRFTVYAWGSSGQPVAAIRGEVDRGGPLPAYARLGGVKWIIDGTPLERNARQTQAYADRPGWQGRSNFTDAELRQILLAALDRPEGLAIHVVGDAETARLLHAMQQLAPPQRWRAKRVRIEHGDGLTADLIPLAKSLGVVVIQNPLHLDITDGPGGPSIMLARLGAERTRASRPLASLLAAKIPLALGSDAGGPAANPFLNIMLATAWRENPAESLTREQALEAYTSGGAYAEGQETRRGRIAVGMDADLAVLSQDVLTAPLPALPATRSVLTLVAGKVVHEDGTLGPPPP